ncbi:hypothetical protein EVAR_80486_1 [Eumeta japonica]|uniref:Uncharacterized protein n=1 Tax=Eumeta variegata TaxID=151549 RepID=A0A4C1ZHU7_EUMVA|nr:hypothetical protein EVAR_80486_1 [Eumeta japonica]
MNVRKALAAPRNGEAPLLHSDSDMEREIATKTKARKLLRVLFKANEFIFDGSTPRENGAEPGQTKEKRNVRACRLRYIASGARCEREYIDAAPPPPAAPRHAPPLHITLPRIYCAAGEMIRQTTTVMGVHASRDRMPPLSCTLFVRLTLESGKRCRHFSEECRFPARTGKMARLKGAYHGPGEGGAGRRRRYSVMVTVSKSVHHLISHIRMVCKFTCDKITLFGRGNANTEVDSTRSIRKARLETPTSVGTVGHPVRRGRGGAGAAQTDLAMSRRDAQLTECAPRAARSATRPPFIASPAAAAGARAASRPPAHGDLYEHAPLMRNVECHFAVV